MFKVKNVFILFFFINILLLSNIFAQTPPPMTINHIAVTEAYKGEDLLIKSTIGEVHHLKKLLLLYRVKSELKQYIPIKMTIDHSGAYSARIPEKHITSKGLEYYIAAINHSGKVYLLFKDPLSPQSVSTRSLDEELEAVTASLESEFAMFAAEDVVVTASRYEQKISEAPAAITVLGEDEIRYYASTFHNDFLRQVPGMGVMSTSASYSDLSIRGFQQLMANKVLTLVDSRSILTDFIGTTQWGIIFTPIEEIKQIEVIRGPGSTLYGANAFSGVANIITKSPGEIDGISITMVGGPDNSMHFTGLVGFDLGDFGFKFSVGYDKLQKWDVYNYQKISDDGFKNLYSTKGGYNYNLDQPEEISWESMKGNFHVEYSFSSKSKFSLGSGINLGVSEILTNDIIGIYDRKGFYNSTYAQYEYDDFRLRAFMNWHEDETGNQYNVESAEITRGDLFAPIFDVEAQDGLSFDLLGGSHYIIYGLGYRKKIIDYLKVMTGRPEGGYIEDHYSGFIQDDFRFLKDFIFVVGGRYDYHPRVKHKLSGRGSLLYKLTDKFIVRTAVGTAFRNPTFLENYVDFGFPVVNIVDNSSDAFYMNAWGNKDLKSENITTFELSFNALPSSKFKISTDLFFNMIDDLITVETVGDEEMKKILGEHEYYNTQNKNGTYTLGMIEYTNQGTKYSYGGELISEYIIKDWLIFNGSYALTKVFDDDEKLFILKTPEHSINLGLLVKNKSGINAGINLHLLSETKWDIQVLNLETKAIVEKSVTIDPKALLNAKIGYWLIDNQLELSLSGQNLFFMRQKHHPLGNEIGSRVMLWVNYMWSKNKKFNRSQPASQDIPMNLY